MGGLQPLLIISLLLVAVDGADSLAKLPDEAIANPAEVKAYWAARLPNTPMPQAILDMLALQEGAQVEGDDSKMGRFPIIYQGAQVEGDDSKMGRFPIIYHDAQVEGDDSKMGRFPIIYQGAQVEGDNSKMGKFPIIYQGAQVDGDESKITRVHRHNGAHKIYGSQMEGDEHKHSLGHGHNHVRLPKAAEDLFFFEKSLEIGSTRSTVIPLTGLNPPFLHHEASKSIPFSPRNLTSIINMLAPASFTMIDDISFTLHRCENPTEQAINGEKAGCSTSIESYLDLIVSILGTSQARAFSADVPKEGIVSQRYTIASVRLLTHSQSILVCHDMAYPYKVFYCHMSLPTRVYQAKLVSEVNGSSLDALAVCHLDTSSWDPEHVFFKLMHVKPGQTTACHYLNRGSMVWVATAKFGEKQAPATQ